MRVNLTEIIKKPFSGEWGTDDTTGDGFPVLRTTNFTNDGIVNYDNVVLRCITKKNISEKLLKKGDILIEKSGGSDKQPVGRVVFFEGEEMKYLFNNFTSLLRVNDSENWNSKYVFYSLYANYLRGGTLPYQNKTTGLHNLKLDSYISNYTIKNISINDQNRIVKQLDLVRSIIELQNDLLNKLDELIKSRFVEMFGDPIINTKGWKIKKLRDFTSVGSSKRIFEKEYVNYGVPFYRTKEIVELAKGNPISTELFISEERFSEIQEKFGTPKAGDLLISAVGTIGIIWIVDGKNDFYYKDGNLIRVDTSDSLNPIFSKYLLELLISEHKKQMTSGTAYSALTISGLSDMDIYDVPLDMQNIFADFVTKVEKQKSFVQKNIDKLETLKKNLMQEYFG